MSDLVVLQRLLLITFLAGCVGCERERHGRAAGLRTHILVGLGSCLIMLTTLAMISTGPNPMAIDPTRMAAQIVSGIGFLGAGTILRFRASVRGLTTAASLWVVAGVGIAVGAGFLIGALAATGIVLAALFGLTRLECHLRKDWFRALVIETRLTPDDLCRIRDVLSSHDVEIRDFHVSRGADPDRCTVELDVKLLSRHHEDAILSEVLRLEGTRKAHWA